MILESTWRVPASKQCPVPYRSLQQTSALHPHGQPDHPDRNHHPVPPRKFWDDSTRDLRGYTESEMVSGALKNDIKSPQKESACKSG